MDTLTEIRNEIDLLDKDIVYLISLRAKLVHAAGLTKTDVSEVPDPERVEKVILKAIQRAVDIGAPITVVEATYRAMIKAFINYERHAFIAANEGPANGV